MLHSNERMDLITEYMTSYEEKIKMANKNGLFEADGSSEDSKRYLSYLQLKYVMFGLDRSLAIWMLRQQPIHI